MSTFDEAFKFTVGIEGGFTDDPRDRGNWTSGVIGTGKLAGTKYGISAMSYPSLDIKSLTLEQAKSIYKRDYWDKARTDELPALIRGDYFDMAVNAGIGTAVRLLQKALGFTVASVDGLIGPKTIARANEGFEPAAVYIRYCAHRLQYYTETKTWGTYGKGWTNRVAACMLETALWVR